MGYIRKQKGELIYWQRTEPMTLGEMIRVKRTYLGMSQRDLGERRGYRRTAAKNTVQLWEADKRPVPLNKLRIVSDVLQLPLERLIPESR